jgi:hypothetical protein
MKMKTSNAKAILSGNTRPMKDELMAHGWRWDGRSWSKTISAEQAAALRDAATEDARRDAARAVKGAKKGCMLTVDGLVRYVSPAYVAPAAQAGRGHGQADQDGFGWNCDARGNFVAAKRIPGSAPHDRV